jgi:hypothetical protein
MSQTNHLIRRKGVWYYRRRVPTALVPQLGRKTIQFSLNTASLKEAKQPMTLFDPRPGDTRTMPFGARSRTSLSVARHP